MVVGTRDTKLEHRYLQDWILGICIVDLVATSCLRCPRIRVWCLHVSCRVFVYVSGRVSDSVSVRESEREVRMRKLLHGLSHQMKKLRVLCASFVLSCFIPYS